MKFKILTVLQIMLLISLLALSFGCWAAVLPEEEIKQRWLNFNQKYDRNFRSWEESNKSFKSFKENIEKIAQHNKLYSQKLTNYKMDINAFTDMDLKEMETFYMGLKISELEKQNFANISHFQPSIRKRLNFPIFIDWRERGAIAPVKNQLACGSCWAFATSAALEAHYFLKHNKSVLLSEQNLVDCVTENFGCEGGWMIPSFGYVHFNGGINPESKYPYEALDGQCRFKSKYIAATCNGYQTILQGDEQHLLQIVATKGPVAVAIEVNSNFINYAHGIYDDPQCIKMVNHAVLVVGYGTEDGADYWLVKNSWGTEWGDKGYIKMARNKHNQCSIATYGSYPLV